jgi:hypothetical protein
LCLRSGIDCCGSTGCACGRGTDCCCI